MKYSQQDVISFVQEEDVKFVRLAFCDVFGVQKNVSVPSSEIDRVFENGIAIDGSAIAGFGDETHSDLFLHPDPSTLAVLPWRPEHGRVVRMYCNICYPDGTPFECDGRKALQTAVETAERAGYSFAFGAEMEFYLFKLDDNGNPTQEPFDNAGYMDVAPADKGENVRREICLTLEQMGISPESSHHEEGRGQNEIAFRYSSPLEAADNAVTFRSAVQTIANRNGLYADFSPKPLDGEPGNGFHINFSVKTQNGANVTPYAIAGVLNRIRETTAFFNATNRSYARLGNHKAPAYLSWSRENRSPLIRIPAAKGEFQRAELRSPDPLLNVYLAFTLLIYAMLEGIEQKAELPPPSDFNLFTAEKSVLKNYQRLPASLKEALSLAKQSDFVQKYIPQSVFAAYRKTIDE